MKNACLLMTMKVKIKILSNLPLCIAAKYLWHFSIDDDGTVCEDVEKKEGILTIGLVGTSHLSNSIDSLEV